MKTLTHKADFPKNQLIEFMNALNQEKRFFGGTLDRIMLSEILTYEERLGRIVGIAGINFLSGPLSAFFKMPLSYLVVLQEFQRQGIGSKLHAARNEIAKEKYNYIIYTITKDNWEMLSLNKSFDGKYLGETKNRYYFLEPFNLRGLCLYYPLRIALKFLLPLRRFARMTFKI